MTANATRSDLPYPKAREVTELPPETAPDKTSSLTSHPRSWLWWLLPVALAPLALGVGSQFRPSNETLAETAPLPVQAITVNPVSAYTVEREYVGEIVAGRTSSLGFEAGGTVVEMLVDEGDTVAADQPLAKLDTRSLQTQRQQLVAQQDQATAQLAELRNGPRQQNIAAARAAVTELEQQVALARLQQGRRQDLYERGAISQEELDQQTFGAGALESRLAQAQSQLDELQVGTRPEQIEAQAARVRQLKAQIQSTEVDLTKSVMTAPFAGRISQRLVDEGVVVSGGQGVLELVESNTVEARIGIPVDVADVLAIGSQHTLEIAQRPYPATITALLPELDATSRTVTAVLKLETAEPLTIGQTARLVLTDTQPAEGFWVPSTALVQGEQGLWSVYVVVPAAGGEPVVARRHVEIIQTEGDRMLVQGMVQPGDQVIPSGTHRVVPGQTVRVIE